VNVPSLSERTIHRDIAAGKFAVGPEILVSTLYVYSTERMFWVLYIKTAVLEELITLNPKACWWIKGDRTNVVKMAVCYWRKAVTTAGSTGRGCGFQAYINSTNTVKVSNGGCH